MPSRSASIDPESIFSSWIDGWQNERSCSGDRLAMADIPIGTHLYRYFNLDIERPSVPNVETWYQRLQDRSAYRMHVMIPFGELRGRLDP